MSWPLRLGSLTVRCMYTMQPALLATNISCLLLAKKLFDLAEVGHSSFVPLPTGWTHLVPQVLLTFETVDSARLHMSSWTIPVKRWADIARCLETFFLLFCAVLSMSTRSASVSQCRSLFMNQGRRMRHSDCGQKYPPPCRVLNTQWRVEMRVI